MTLLFHAGHPQTSPQPTGLSRLERRERQPSLRSVDCPVLCGQGYTCGALGFCLWWQRICELGSDAHLYSFGSCTGVSLGSDSHFSSSTLLADVFLGCLHSSLGFGGIVGMPLPPAAHSCIFSPCNYPACVLLALWTSTSDLLGAPKTHIGGAGVSADRSIRGFILRLPQLGAACPCRHGRFLCLPAQSLFPWHPAQAFP